MVNATAGPPVRSERTGDVAVVHAADYLNRLSGERIERACREHLRAGCRALVVDFSETSVVNSIGVSILMGVIDTAERAQAPLVFAGASGQAAQLFELLGLTRHVSLAPDSRAGVALLAQYAQGVAP
ncbi:MAG TPA: STAS domain-containing protein [Pyrinomonadaceae bacterium]|jgi:anti-anti-sigma factor